MALVLKTKTNRKGDVKGFDVIAASDDTATVADTLQGVKAGEYTVHADGKLINATVGYRTVQDIDLS